MKLTDEDGNVTTVNLDVFQSGNLLSTYNAEPDEDTIPSHTASIENIAGNLYSYQSSNILGMTFSGLQPNIQYKMWVFGLRYGFSYTQTVSITGDLEAGGFDQVGGNSELTVNENILSPATSLTNVSRIYSPDINGDINIRVSGDAGYFISGVAIQEVESEETSICFISGSSK